MRVSADIFNSISFCKLQFVLVDKLTGLNHHIFVVRSGGYQGSSPSRACSPSRPYVSSGPPAHSSRTREAREPRPRRIGAPQVDPAADRAIAEAIVERMQVGYFKSTDCQSLVRNMYPNHPLANASSGVMGQRFVRHILPLLLSLGVTEPNPNRRPRRFQITEEAKRRLRARGAASTDRSSSGPAASVEPIR